MLALLVPMCSIRKQRFHSTSLHPSINYSSATPQASNRAESLQCLSGRQVAREMGFLPTGGSICRDSTGSRRALVCVSKDSGPHCPPIKGYLVSFSKSSNSSSLMCLYSELGPAGHREPSTAEQILGSQETAGGKAGANALLGAGLRSQGREMRGKCQPATAT